MENPIHIKSISLNVLSQFWRNTFPNLMTTLLKIIFLLFFFIIRYKFWMTIFWKKNFGILSYYVESIRKFLAAVNLIAKEWLNLRFASLSLKSLTFSFPTLMYVYPSFAILSFKNRPRERRFFTFLENEVTNFAESFFDRDSWRKNHRWKKIYLQPITKNFQLLWRGKLRLLHNKTLSTWCCILLL